jgi:outer membrane autotransporter protein
MLSQYRIRILVLLKGSFFEAGVEGINDLTSTGKNKILEGDVFATSYGTNKLTLDTTASYLQGNIISEKKSKNDAPYGANNITISNGATWRPVYDNRYGTDCVKSDAADAATKNLAANKVSERATTYDTAGNKGTTITLNKDGIIDLTWDGWTNGKYDTTRAYRTNGKQQTNTFRSLTVAKLDGSDGIIKVDSNLAKGLSDTLTVGAASTATSIKVQVNYDDFYANSVKGDLVTGKALVVTDNSSGKNLTVSGTKSEYNEKTYNVTVEKDATETNKWNITKIEDIGGTPTPNITENTRHAADSRDNVNNIWEIETNSLVKRLGDLRSMSKNTDKYDNMWAKYGHGTQEVGSSGRNTEVKYNQFQIGYDKLFARKDGKMYRGIMVSRINGDASYERGTGDTNSTTVGLYRAWLGNKGHFYDVTFRYGKISTDYSVTDLSDNYSTADYSMWATTLSGEYGYRKDLGKGAYIEPSAELILGHVGSADYTTSKNMNVYLDATKHAITRLGFMAGKDFGKANAYFKANYYHDFAGGGALTTGTVNYENDAAKNWEEIGIGGNVQLSKNASAYAEVRKLFGNVKSNVNFSVGARWSF